MTDSDENLEIDLVRRTLEEARASARMRGVAADRDGPLLPRKRIGAGSGQGGANGAPPERRGAGQRRRWSGPGADARDPQPLGRATRELAKRRGWSAQVAEGMVFGEWAAIVGQQIAEHAAPTVLRDGVLTVTAESTAWATQLRMMCAQLLAKIAAAVGDGVVTSLKITGPAAPSWRKGPLHISGRGPRDTYG